MATQDIYTDDELDNEWAQYVASLNTQNDLINKKNREKKKIERRERETMINLQKHLRSLSRARIELEDAAIDSIDDIDSSSETGTVNIIGTPISDRLLDLESCSDSDDIAPVPLLSLNDSVDSEHCELNDSHCLNDSSDSSVSPKSSSSKDSSIDPIEELQYDHELEALKEELNQFKRRNFNQLRTNDAVSQEEVLLSVLNIDKKDIDKKQLERCTKKAIKKYNSIYISPIPESKSKTIIMRPRRLADPYEEEWNGFNPDDYVWYDNIPEGQCYDDKELSLRNRRMQYLVIMAIENKYCSISDLTYKQNELLLLYQASLNF